MFTSTIFIYFNILNYFLMHFKFEFVITVLYSVFNLKVNLMVTEDFFSVGTNIHYNSLNSLMYSNGIL
jgi:hypothetical protein